MKTYVQTEGIFQKQIKKKEDIETHELFIQTDFHGNFPVCLQLMLVKQSNTYHKLRKT